MRYTKKFTEQIRLIFFNVEDRGKTRKYLKKFKRKVVLHSVIFTFLNLKLKIFSLKLILYL